MHLGTLAQKSELAGAGAFKRLRDAGAIRVELDIGDMNALPRRINADNPAKREQLPRGEFSRIHVSNVPEYVWLRAPYSCMLSAQMLRSMACRYHQAHMKPRSTFDIHRTCFTCLRVCPVGRRLHALLTRSRADIFSGACRLACCPCSLSWCLASRQSPPPG